VNLTDVIISSDIVKDRDGAAGASVAGTIVLGPVELLAGALVGGGDIQVPAGAEVTQATKTAATVRSIVDGTHRVPVGFRHGGETGFGSRRRAAEPIGQSRAY